MREASRRREVDMRAGEPAWGGDELPERGHGIVYGAGERSKEGWCGGDEVTGKPRRAEVVAAQLSVA